MTAFFDPDATRVATVHPLFGKEISPPPLDAESTVCLRPNSAPATVFTRSEMYIPVCGHLPSGEITASWSTPASAGSRWVPSFTASAIRKRIAGIGIILALLAASLVMLQRPADQQSEESARATQQTTVVQPKEPAPPTPPEQHGTSGQAAEDLLDGRFKEATARYRFLHRQKPDIAVYSIAVRILERDRKLRGTP